MWEGKINFLRDFVWFFFSPRKYCTEFYCTVDDGKEFLVPGSRVCRLSNYWLHLVLDQALEPWAGPRWAVVSTRHRASAYFVALLHQDWSPGHAWWTPSCMVRVLCMAFRDFLGWNKKKTLHHSRYAELSPLVGSAHQELVLLPEILGSLEVFWEVEHLLEWGSYVISVEEHLCVMFGVRHWCIKVKPEQHSYAVMKERWPAPSASPCQW